MVYKRIANSPFALLAIFAATMFTSAVVYALLEDAALADSLYWALVTATTLGYGDFSPHSAGGKVLTAVLISFTVFILLPTITANVAALLIVNRDAFTHEEQEEIKAVLRDIRAKLDRGDG